jgi:hypothetical protein
MKNPFDNKTCETEVVIFNRFWKGEFEITPQTIANAIQRLNELSPETKQNYGAIVDRFIREYSRLSQSNMTAAWSTVRDIQELRNLYKMCRLVFPATVNPQP